MGTNTIPWQIDAAQTMMDLMGRLLPIDTIVLGGSVEAPETLDKYSDVDMKIILSNNTLIDIEHILDEIAAAFAPVFGYEVIGHATKDAIRLCLENGMRFDLVIRYPSDKVGAAGEDTLAVQVDRLVNQFWFFAVMALVKLGRRDYLIGSHLALELYQLIIVVKMLVRDAEKGTNIHRFGDGESVAALATLSTVGGGSGTEERVLKLVLAAGTEMESELARLGFEYPGKMDVLLGMAMEWIG